VRGCWLGGIVLDLSLDVVVDGVRGLDLEEGGVSGEVLDGNWHATTETENEVEG